MFEVQICTINPLFSLSLALPTQKKKRDERAQNHKHGSMGLDSLLVCTDEVMVKDGSIFVASLDLLKDGLKSINTEE